MQRNAALVEGPPPAPALRGGCADSRGRGWGRGVCLGVSVREDTRAVAVVHGGPCPTPASSAPGCWGGSRRPGKTRLRAGCPSSAPRLTAHTFRRPTVGTTRVIGAAVSRPTCRSRLRRGPGVGTLSLGLLVWSVNTTHVSRGCPGPLSRTTVRCRGPECGQSSSGLFCQPGLTPHSLPGAWGPWQLAG